MERIAEQVGPELRERLDVLHAEGRAIWSRFDDEVRRHTFHPFVAADYERVLRALLPLRNPGARFLEWGSATGIVTITADMLGFDACGIEIDADLVATAREVAERFDSDGRFAVGSFLPDDFEWTPDSGDGRLGTIRRGAAAYPALDRSLEEFDVVFGYPWTGEEAMMLDLMHERGGRGACLLMHGADDVRLYRN